MINNQFFYRMTFLAGEVESQPFEVEFLRNLDQRYGPDDRFMQALVEDQYNLSQGLYMWAGQNWQQVLPFADLCDCIIHGSTVMGATNLANGTDFTDPAHVVTLWKNGAPYVGTVANGTPDDLWVIVTQAANVIVEYIPPATTSSIGGVVVGAGLNVTTQGLLSIAPASSASLGGVKSGIGLEIDVDGTINLVTASSTVLGGVMVDGSTILIDSNGVISTALKTVNGQVGNVVVSAVDANSAGHTLIADSGATTGTIKLLKLVAGANVTITNDGNGNPVIASTVTQYVLPAATTSTLGGVIPDGTTITVDGTGHIAARQYVLPVASASTLGGVTVNGNGLSIDSATGLLHAAVQSVNTQTGAVTVQALDANTATGVSLITNSGATTGNILLRRIVAGTGVTLGNDASGNLVLNSQVFTGLTQLAGAGTATQLVYNNGVANGIAQTKSLAAGTNITITDNGAGTLTIASQQPQVIATTTVLGSVKVGTGLTVDVTGLLTLSAPKGTAIGGVKADGVTTAIAADGTISVISSPPQGVTSLNSATGALTYVLRDYATSAGGLSLIADSGATNTPKLYQLVAGDSTIVLSRDTANNIAIRANIPPSGVTSFNNVTGAVTFSAQDNKVSTGGKSLIVDSGSVSNTIKLVELVALDSTIVLGNDANGNITIKANIPPSGVQSVTSLGTGTSLVVDSGATSQLATLMSLAAGTGVSFATANNVLTINATGYVLPPATTSTLGGVSVSSGLAVTAGGALSVAPATATTIGGVIAGANVTIGSDGTLSVAAPYVLPQATTTVLGGVTVPASGGLTVTAGALAVAPATGTQLGGVKPDGTTITVAADGTISAIPPAAGVMSVATVGTGTSQVFASGAAGGTAQIKSLVAGSNINIVDNLAGTLTVSAVMNIPAATTSTIGGVIVGGGLAVTSGGTLSVAPPSSTVLGGVKAGANVTIAGDGTISVAAPYVLPQATTSVLGGMIVGTGLSVASGVVSVAPATATVLGGIIPGTGLAVDGSGVLSVTAQGGVTSVNTLTGAVTVSAVDNSTATGTTLIKDSGATTGVMKFVRLVAGTNIALSSDGNGNLVVTGTGTGITQIESAGAGTSLVSADGTVGGIASIRSLNAGSGVTITQQADQSLTIGMSYSLPIATASTLGGIMVGTGLTINSGSGLLSLAPPSGVNLGGVRADGTTITVNGSGVLSAVQTTPPLATSTTAGTVIVPSGSGISVNGSGSIALTAASATVLGGVKVGSGLAVDGTGVLSVTNPGGVTSVSTLTGAVTVEATDYSTSSGVSLIQNNGATTANIKLLRLVAGNNVSITPDAYGNLNIGTTVGTGVNSVTAATGGTGTSLVFNDGTVGGAAQIKTLAAGANVTITSDAGNDTLTIASTYTIPAATSSVLGGVTVASGSGLTVTSGALALAAPSGVNIGGVKAGTGITIGSDGTISASTSYTLPPATTSVLGGVIVGTGLSVTAGGVLSVTAVGGVTSVSTLTGAVTVQATDNSTASGVSLIANSGSTTANIKLLRLVAGANTTITPDTNGNLVIASTGSGGGGGVTSETWGGSGTLTGDLTFVAGPNIAFSNSGNTVTISNTFAGVAEAPLDSQTYARKNATWVAIQDTSAAIYAVNSDTTAGSVSIVEASPPANSAVMKSLSAGTNVTLTDNGKNIVISASVPGVVSTVNGVAPNGSGNVTLTPAEVGAVPLAGNVTMTGPLNFGSQVLTGLPNAANPTDAVSLADLQNLVIDGGVIG